MWNLEFGRSKLMGARQPCVYFLASRRNGTLYVGVTSNLPAHVWQHRNNVVDGFSSRYRVHDLVWFEVHETMDSAIEREKAIKEWRRAWKVDLIETSNPYWHDLYAETIWFEAQVAGSRPAPG
jgi:putative endonuclease